MQDEKARRSKRRSKDEAHERRRKSEKEQKCAYFFPILKPTRKMVKVIHNEITRNNVA